MRFRDPRSHAEYGNQYYREGQRNAATANFPRSPLDGVVNRVRIKRRENVCYENQKARRNLLLHRAFHVGATGYG